ncbi:hypothetical protein D3C81_747020 [compost metagenome]
MIGQIAAFKATPNPVVEVVNKRITGVNAITAPKTMPKAVAIIVRVEANSGFSEAHSATLATKFAILVNNGAKATLISVIAFFICVAGSKSNVSIWLLSKVAF